MLMKKYLEIERFKEKYADAIQKGDIIHCSEKLDGAHGSFSYDKKNEELNNFLSKINDKNK